MFLDGNKLVEREKIFCKRTERRYFYQQSLWRDGSGRMHSTRDNVGLKSKRSILPKTIRNKGCFCIFLYLFMQIYEFLSYCSHFNNELWQDHQPRIQGCRWTDVEGLKRKEKEWDKIVNIDHGKEKLLRKTENNILFDFWQVICALFALLSIFSNVSTKEYYLKLKTWKLNEQWFKNHYLINYY